MGPSRVRPIEWQVLQAVHRLGPTPQHVVAKHTGCQRSTVNGAVKRLSASGWLTEAGRSGVGRGRPAILLAVNRSAGCFAGIDITATELHSAAVALDGGLLDEVSSPLSRDRSPASVLEQIDLTLRGVLSRAGMEVAHLRGLWAGVNGAVDQRGVVVTCVSLGWHNEPICDALAERYGS